MLGELVFMAGLGAQQSDLQARGPVRLFKAGQRQSGWIYCKRGNVGGGRNIAEETWGADALEGLEERGWGR